MLAAVIASFIQKDAVHSLSASIPGKRKRAKVRRGVSGMLANGGKNRTALMNHNKLKVGAEAGIVSEGIAQVIEDPGNPRSGGP